MLRGTRRSARVRTAGLLVAALAFTAAPAYAGTATVGGVVTDADTGEPLADACVLLWKTEGEDFAWEQYPDHCTDADGRWSYAGLDPGTYYAQVQRMSYVTQFAYDQYHHWDATRFTVSDGDSVEMEPIAMRRAGEIAGTVTDAATGEPVQGICVSTSGEGTHASGCTNDAGAYLLEGLLPHSEYRLQLYDPESRYLPEYAHDVFDFDYEKAATFAVVAGQETRADEDVSRAASISGTVTDAATGEPVPNVCVFATPDPYGFDGAGYGCTDEQGAYRMSGMTPGTFYVGADDYTGTRARTWHPAGTDPSGATAVTVGDGQDLTGVDVAMSLAAYVTGTVTDAATGAPLRDVCVNGVSVDGRWFRNPGEPGNCSDDEGRYTLAGLPQGEVKVFFNATDNVHLSRWYGGETEADATVLNVVAGETTTGIDAAIQEGGRISGRVTEARTKKPIENACVTVGVYSHRSGENGTQWPSVCTGPDGTYEMKGLTPGRYTVEFYDPDGAWAWQFFPNKADRLNAAKIEVTAGGSVTGINARLSPGGTIEGVVRDAATGLPAEGVCMDPYSARDPRPFGTGYCTQADGRYVLRGFPTTKVKVQFWGDGYVPEFAFDKETHETATPISTTGGATVTVPDVVVAKYPHVE